MAASPRTGFSSVRRVLLGLYLRNLGAGVLGFATIAVLNALTPLEFFREQRTSLLYEGGWREFILFYPLVLCLVVLLQYWVQQPVSAMARRLEQGEEVEEPMATRARRRLINLPFFMGFIHLCVYLVVGDRNLLS